MILWGLYAGLYLQKPIVWTRLRPGVPFFGASHPFRRPFLRSISGGSHRPAHKNSRAFSSFLCTALAFFPRSCYTTHEVASFKPMLQVCICALLPMQPYTPHGDSNFTPVGLTKAPGDATLYPARGQQPLHLCLFFATDLGCNLIPRTGTATSMRPTICVYLPGCNLIPRTGTATASPASRPGRTGWMQPYTPHGDSNDVDARPANTDPSDATLYPARGQQLCGPAAPGCRRVDATLYPARGQQRPLHRGHPGLAGMQPYTPHGDSNPVEPLGPQVQHGCNLIPRTGTATGLPALGGVALHLMQPYTPHGDSNHKSIHFAKFFEDATLYPARGQQHPGVQALCGRQRMQPYTPHGDSNSLRSV